MHIPIYHEDFQCKEDIESQFDVSLPENCEILYASYEIDGCDGTATVIGRMDGELFEVHGCHCSCCGLEEQWDPEETSVAYFLQQAEVQEVRVIRRDSYPTVEEWRILAEYCKWESV